MHTPEEEDQFNEMMEIAAAEQKARLLGEDIAGQPDGYESELTYAEHKEAKQREENLKEQKYQEGWRNFSRNRDPHPHEPKPQKFVSTIESEVKIANMLECALDTEEYLAYLKAMKIRAVFSENSILVGFFRGRYDKFVSDNTP